MPLTIDEEKFATQETLDLSKPQGTPQGIPVKQIPQLDYPRCVYKHPPAPFEEVLHRNVNHEIVEREIVATEHEVRTCQNEAELKKLLKDGWTTTPYIPQAPPKTPRYLYPQKPEEAATEDK